MRIGGIGFGFGDGLNGRVPVWTASIFKDDSGDSKVATMGEAEVRGADAHGKCTPCGTPGKLKDWALAWASPNLNFRPGNALGDAGAECLCCSLLCAEAGGETFSGVVHLAATVSDLCRGKDTRKEAVAVTRDGAADACYFHEIGAGAKNHNAQSF